MSVPSISTSDTPIKILVFTHVQGGCGDISSASKIIRTICVEYANYNLEIYWLLDCSVKKEQFANQTLIGLDSHFVKRITTWYGEGVRGITFDILIQTPCLSRWELRYLLGKTEASLTNPNNVIKVDEAGMRIHPLFDPGVPYLILGINEGEGVLFRELPEFQLDSLDDASLRDQLDFDFSNSTSLNVGYAHHFFNKLNFIDCVAIHDTTDTNIVVVCNTNGEFISRSFHEFAEGFFIDRRLQLWKSLNFDSVTLKDETHTRTVAVSENDVVNKQLTVILRDSFSYHDFGMLQNGAERVLVTGNNSAFDAWSKRTTCKLFLYEDVANAGVTDEFLRAQLRSLEAISPASCALLRMFDEQKLQRGIDRWGRCIVDDTRLLEQFEEDIRRNHSSPDPSTETTPFDLWFQKLRSEHNFIEYFKPPMDAMIKVSASYGQQNVDQP